ncbi:MAG: sigma-54-dependent Fis family transcriptional regulator [Gammaproteobacteria bacterium]|nr:sigma-54-dependent Fis family transcriptional regulator [Gammaproteobacteria bacterium]
MEQILVVDDDPEILALLSTWLAAEGFRVATAGSGSDALAGMNQARPSLVITDLKMEGMSGIDLLASIHRDNPLLPVIMLSGQARIPDAVKATHMGSAAFLTKPVDRDELVQSVKRTLRLTADCEQARQIFSEKLVYQSRAMAELVELAVLAAESDVTVFITGATGTGKEVVAEAIHGASARREHPFVAVNCGAIPEQLLESELFGHEKGAFTGAQIRHEGLFRAASGGTLFLDEIGDMPLALQVKLLRVLQDFAVRPVGSVKSFPVNVRIISATHRDLDEAVRERQFREDLFYRLKVVPLHIPPLADRREDIPLLISHFLHAYARKHGGDVKHFAPDAVEYLVAAAWPGNIRQLNNVVELCATLCKTQTIPLSLAKRAVQDRAGEVQTLKEARQAFERSYLSTVLRITHGHVANAARLAGRNRTEFYKLLGQYGIDPATFRRGGKGAYEQ